MKWSTARNANSCGFLLWWKLSLLIKIWLVSSFYKFSTYFQANKKLANEEEKESNIDFIIPIPKPWTNSLIFSRCNVGTDIDMSLGISQHRHTSPSNGSPRLEMVFPGKVRNSDCSSNNFKWNIKNINGIRGKFWSCYCFMEKWEIQILFQTGVALLWV